MMDEEGLSEIIPKDLRLRFVEPDIYSVYPPEELRGSYARFGASTIYDLVACNRFYNRLMWGYSVKEYLKYVQKLRSDLAGIPGEF